MPSVKLEYEDIVDLVTFPFPAGDAEEECEEPTQEEASVELEEIAGFRRLETIWA